MQMTSSQPSLLVMSKRSLPGVINFFRYNEKIINNSSKFLVFYLTNNIMILTLKQKIFNVEKGSTLKMLLSFDQGVMRLPS